MIASCPVATLCAAGSASTPGGAGVIPGLPSGLSSGLASGVADGVFGALTTWVARSAGWLVRHLDRLLVGPTRIDLGTRWWLERAHQLGVLTCWVLLPLLGVATIGAVVRQDLGRLARVWLLGVPVAMFAAAFGTAAVTLGVRVTDAMCQAVDPGGAGALLSAVAGALPGRGLPGFVDFLAAGLATLAALLLWLELVVRSAVVSLATAFLPLAFATVVWPAVAPVARRYVEALTALLLSKFVVVAALSLGASAVADQRAGADTALSGVAVLLIAAFSPFAVLRLVPFVEAGAIGHLEGLSRRPLQAAGAATRTARGLGGDVSSLIGTGAAAADPGGSDGVAERSGDYQVAALLEPVEERSGG